MRSNTLDLRGGPVWVAADIHLGPQMPHTHAAFLRMLEQARSQARALLLCGDIFDVWIGDDDALETPPDWLAPIVQALAATGRDTALWLGRGNRDFLLGSAFADAVHARLLPDSALIDTDAGRVLVSHGDEYCQDDPRYQRFRRWVRNPALQRAYLALSLPARRRIAAWARRRSQAANQHKPMALMDVTPAAIDAALATSGATRLVHGHTHRPAVHMHDVAGQPRERIVLPDWDADHATHRRGGWLVLDHAGARMQSCGTA